MSQSRGKNIVAWVLQVLLAALFVMVAFPKLTSDPEAVANFERWGLSDGFRMLIGGLEVLGAVGLLIPMTTFFAAIGLSLLMLGGAWTHFSNGEGAAVLVPLVFLAVLAVLAFLRLPGRER